MAWLLPRRLSLACLLLVFTACATTGSRIEELRRRAEAGDLGAQVALGHHYAAGDGVERDLVRAASLYRGAAEAGNAEGQLALGLLYREGAGVPQDHPEAARWIRRAAQSGHAKARYYLGIMHREGDGVPRDNVAAHAWLNLAAAALPQGEREQAARQRDWLSEVMTPVEIAEAQRLAREWAAGGR